jgi:hypothetical protein
MFHADFVITRVNYLRPSHRRCDHPRRCNRMRSNIPLEIVFMYGGDRELHYLRALPFAGIPARDAPAVKPQSSWCPRARVLAPKLEHRLCFRVGLCDRSVCPRPGQTVREIFSRTGRIAGRFGASRVHRGTEKKSRTPAANACAGNASDNKSMLSYKCRDG